MAQTLCPSCGFTPIPAGAEECPACHEPFAFVPTYKRSPRLDRGAMALGDDEAGATMMGGTVFTSAVSVHPKQAVGAFILLAFTWVVRASGALGAGPPPTWAYGLVGAALLASLLLYIRRGPAKLFAQLVAIAAVLCALGMALPDVAQFTALSYAANGAASLFLVAGEPGRIRRWFGLGLAIATAIAAVASLELGNAPLRLQLPASAPRQELVSQQFGFRLLLPSGFHRLQPGEPNLFPASVEGNRTDLTLGAPDLLARLSVEKDGGTQLIGDCLAQHAALGGADRPGPVAHQPPAAFGKVALVYPLRIGRAAGQLACAALPDGRFVSLAVVSLSGDVGEAEDAAGDLGDGLSLQ